MAGGLGSKSVDRNESAADEQVAQPERSVARRAAPVRSVLRVARLIAGGIEEPDARALERRLVARDQGQAMLEGGGGEQGVARVRDRELAAPPGHGRIERKDVTFEGGHDLVA